MKTLICMFTSVTEGKGKVLWDANVILMENYFQNGQSIAHAQCITLEVLRENIKLKLPGKFNKGMLFHRYNFPDHESLSSMLSLRIVALNWLSTRLVRLISLHHRFPYPHSFRRRRIHSVDEFLNSQKNRLLFKVVLKPLNIAKKNLMILKAIIFCKN